MRITKDLTSGTKVLSMSFYADSPGEKDVVTPATINIYLTNDDKAALSSSELLVSTKLNVTKQVMMLAGQIMADYESIISELNQIVTDKRYIVAETVERDFKFRCVVTDLEKFPLNRTAIS